MLFFKWFARINIFSHVKLKWKRKPHPKKLGQYFNLLNKFFHKNWIVFSIWKFCFLILQILLFFCWTIIAGWNGAVHYAVYYQWSGRTGFFISISLIPWLILLVVFVLKMLKLHKRVPKVVNWSLTVSVVHYWDILKRKSWQGNL